MSSLYQLDAAGQTDTGLKRNRNEDAYKVLVPPTDAPQSALGALFMVADGMGGMGGGDIASRATLEEIIRQFYAGADAPEDTVSHLLKAVEAANSFVRKQAAEINLAHIGSTVAGLVLTPQDEAIIFNVGDSRVYRSRASYIELLSRDQSVNAQQMEAGQITSDDGRSNNNLTAFVGQPVPLKPMLHRTSVQSGDTFIICSDGLWSLVEPNEILDTVKGVSAEKGAGRLISLARKRGAPDNVTVIIVHLEARKKRYSGILIAGIVALLAFSGGALVLVNNPNLLGGSETPAGNAVITRTQPPATASSRAEGVTEEAPTSDVVAMLPTDTLPPSETPTITATYTLSPVPSDTQTRIPSATPLPTNTPTHAPSETPTLRPSDTPTITNTPSPTFTPSNTLTLTATLTLTPSVTPTPTETPEPTVTLNPALVTSDPLATAAPTQPGVPSIAGSSAQSSETVIRQAKLDYARNYAVVLQADVLLFYGNKPGIELIEGDSLARIVPNETPADSIAGILLFQYVRIERVSGETVEGWIPQSALENALPETPQLIAIADIGVNVRAGDSISYRATSALLPGEYRSILGRSPGGWYFLSIGNQRGWVTPEEAFVYVWGHMENITRRDAPTLTPSPTYTPTVTPEFTLEAGIPEGVLPTETPQQADR